MKKLNHENLNDLAIGCAILGSGGGGDTDFPCMMAKVQMDINGPVSLINYSDLKPDDVIMAVGFIGAPSAETEKLQSGREFEVMFEYVERNMNKKITVLMPYEIGGGNGITPIIEAARLGLPVLDVDTMGRAFPEAQMTSYNLVGGFESMPGFITDCLGNTTIIYSSSIEILEKIGRQICIAMGSIAAFGFFPITADRIQQVTIPKSVSKALSIGKAVRESRENGDDPVNAVLNLCKGVKIGSGIITDIDRAIEKGFLYGSVTIKNKTEKMELAFKNEYLIAKRNEKIVATTPDILMLLEQQTGVPIESQKLQYGLKVHLVALPAPALWTTPAGLQLVGPRSFGYETDYQPISAKREACKVNNNTK
jgi:DUF917 family protein